MKKIINSSIIVVIVCLIVIAGFWLFKDFSQPQLVESADTDSVSGWAWSETIGWLSFNCTDQGTCGSSNYGVNIDIYNGKFSGYAWSDNIGWISFNESDLSGCPKSPCRAEVVSPGQLGKSNVNLKGWARALAYGGGWDGWIRFDHGQSNEPYIDTNNNWQGWAWGGSDTNGQAGVIGWISLSGANYGVILTPSNNPPSVSCDNNEFFAYCIDSRHPILSWIYSDPDGDEQAAYYIQIDNKSNFSSPVKDTGWIDSSSNSYATTGINFDWSTTYYWRVKVRDTQGLESSWCSPICSFPTPLHAYPEPDFSWTPVQPVPDEEVQFTDETAYYGGATGSAWSWTFKDADPDSSNQENPITIFQDPGSKQVDLTVTDSDNYSCSVSDNVQVNLPLPKWKEIRPW